MRIFFIVLLLSLSTSVHAEVIDLDPIQFPIILPYDSLGYDCSLTAAEKYLTEELGDYSHRKYIKTWIGMISGHAASTILNSLTLLNKTESPLVSITELFNGRSPFYSSKIAPPLAPEVYKVPSSSYFSMINQLGSDPRKIQAARDLMAIATLKYLGSRTLSVIKTTPCDTRNEAGAFPTLERNAFTYIFKTFSRHEQDIIGRDVCTFRPEGPANPEYLVKTCSNHEVTIKDAATMQITASTLIFQLSRSSTTGSSFDIRVKSEDSHETSLSRILLNLFRRDTPRIP